MFSGVCHETLYTFMTFGIGRDLASSHGLHIVFSCAVSDRENTQIPYAVYSMNLSGLEVIRVAVFQQ